MYPHFTVFIKTSIVTVSKWKQNKKDRNGRKEEKGRRERGEGGGQSLHCVGGRRTVNKKAYV